MVRKKRGRKPGTKASPNWKKPGPKVCNLEANEKLDPDDFEFDAS